MRLAWHLGPVLRGIRGHRIAAALVATQFAIGLAIAVLSVLIGDYFVGTRNAPAMSPEHDLVIAEVQLPGRSARIGALRARVLDDLRDDDMCVGATVVDRLPLHALEPDLDDIAGMQVAAFDAREAIAAVAGLELREGRDFVEDDLRAAVTAAIVSPALANELPLGSRFHSRARGPAIVVGVADLRSHTFGDAALAAIFAYDDRASPRMVVLARAKPGLAGDLATVLGERRGYHVAAVPALEAMRQRSSPVSSVLAILAATVGMILLVVLMGSMGLTYSLISARTREIGLRRAMGATRRDVAWHFVLESTLLTLVGAFAGMVVVMSVLPLLFEEQEHFAIRWSLVAITVVAVIALNLVAALVPARKAAAIPPVVASRT